MMFRDRREAAELLLEKLKHYAGCQPLVLGIPRGAMPMAEIIAQGLDGELGAILVHKIPHPDSEELAIGSIGLSGHAFELRVETEFLGIPRSYFLSAAKEQLKELRRRQKILGVTQPICQDRTVILVDDGIATGATVLGAIQEIKDQMPRKLIVAAAVISRHSAEIIQPLVNELVVLHIPEMFYGVGDFFIDFRQVTDEEVKAILTEARKTRPESPSHK